MSGRHRGPLVVGLVLLAVMAALALSVDVPHDGYGIKADESVYVSAALSAAYDFDFRYERRDLARFEQLYHAGPEGIFLKRGAEGRLYFAKALLYPAVAAPFVRLFGLNGLLLLNVLLLAAAATCAYAFLAAQMEPFSAAVFTGAFFGASSLPVWGVFLMPEVLNLTLVLVAYFLWLYKEVAPGSWLDGRWTDLAAAALLGAGTYSKPAPIALLVAPLVVLPWIRKRIGWGFIVGATAVAVAALFFAFNAAATGEFNYQGGDRKTFYANFPFDANGTTFGATGGGMATDASNVLEPLTPRQTIDRFLRNTEYFVLGRHFGLLPYFFPAVVACLAWLLAPARRDPWRLLTFGGIVLSAAVLLVLLPWSWSGGGGPLGNRYYSSVYPLFLFLVPPGTRIRTGLVAWLGGTLFTAKVLANPFLAAKFPYEIMAAGPARLLPVELSMANDLPIRLDPSRGYVTYGPDDERRVILYFLDRHAWPPEPHGMWVSGDGRADVIVRTERRMDHLMVVAQSPIATVLTISAGARPVTVTIQPGRPQTFNVPTAGAPHFEDYAYLLSARSSNGFVPHLIDPTSSDYRDLGVQLQFTPVF
jgi:hypothetical protein